MYLKIKQQKEYFFCFIFYRIPLFTGFIEGFYGVFDQNLERSSYLLSPKFLETSY